MSSAGVLAAATAARFPSPETPAAPASSPPARNGSFSWWCSPGPRALGEMDVIEPGYLKAIPEGPPSLHEFYFARAMYSDGRSDGGLRSFGRSGRFRGRLGDSGPSWSIDYPRGDRTMMLVATRLSNLDACGWEHPVALADPDLRRYPFLYTLEWGAARLTEAEVAGLRGYLMAGGLLMVDDFWGTWEWANFEQQMARVLPDHPIVEIPRDHLLFRIHYAMEGEILQVPNVGNGRDVARGRRGARTWEQDGYEPHVRGIFGDDVRLMVVIYWNTDLGDALEWAEDPFYPLKYSTFASELFLNTIIYAMSG